MNQPVSRETVTVKVSTIGIRFKTQIEQINLLICTTEWGLWAQRYTTVITEYTHGHARQSTKAPISLKKCDWYLVLYSRPALYDDIVQGNKQMHQGSGWLNYCRRIYARVDRGTFLVPQQIDTKGETKTAVHRAHVQWSANWPKSIKDLALHVSIYLDLFVNMVIFFFCNRLSGEQRRLRIQAFWKIMMAKMKKV